MKNQEAEIAFNSARFPESTEYEAEFIFWDQQSDTTTSYYDGH